MPSNIDVVLLWGGGILLCTFIYLLFALAKARRGYQRLRQVVDKYLSPVIRKRLIDGNMPIVSQAGEQRHMSVLFSDIRGFTTLSETYTPYELSLKMNDYLDEMCQVIIDNGGIIDKFMGDAILAFWPGQPDYKKPEYRALRTAIQMEQRLKQLQQEDTHFADLQMGIGLNAGTMYIGDIGGKGRFDHTVLGDNVNLASRIEGLTKAYGVPVLVSDMMYEFVGKSKKYIWRLVDEVIVKGKSFPIRIYQPLLRENGNMVLAQIYEQAFIFYQKGKFENAQLLFEQIKYDPPTQTLLNRIRYEEINPQSWNGIWKWAVK